MDTKGTRVCAVVVIYRPDPQVLGRLLSQTSTQVGRIVVVDNDSSDGVEALCAEAPGLVHVIRPGDNVGVGAGHNIGIDHARSHGFRYVLILDQDSIPESDMVVRLIEAMEGLQARGRRVCAVGPRYVDPRTGRSSYFVRFKKWGLQRLQCEQASEDAIIATDFLISSGSLIPVAVLDDVGGMDEALFIDHVDTDWYLRARKRGYAAFGVCRAVMQHSLGSRTVRVYWIRERHVAVRSPLRLYYIVRNSLLLYRRSHVPWSLRLADAPRLASLFLFFSLLVPPQLENLGMMLKGAWHGLRGVSGRYREDRAQ